MTLPAAFVEGFYTTLHRELLAFLTAGSGEGAMYD